MHVLAAERGASVLRPSSASALGPTTTAIAAEFRDLASVCSANAPETLGMRARHEAACRSASSPLRAAPHRPEIYTGYQLRLTAVSHAGDPETARYRRTIFYVRSMPLACACRAECRMRTVHSRGSCRMIPLMSPLSLRPFACSCTFAAPRDMPYSCTRGPSGERHPLYSRER